MDNAEISGSFEVFPDNLTPVINPAAGDLGTPATILPPSKPQVIHLRSLEELRAAASDWDDLWRRSEVTFPTMRAELLAQWIEHFAAGAEFHAIAVQQEGRWVAALPIVRRKIGRLINAGVLPCNEWSSSGECLLDFSADVNRVMPVFRCKGWGQNGFVAHQAAGSGRY